MKYGNHKTVLDGITFDSKKEAKRYALLKVYEKAKEISNLQLQPKFYFDNMKGDNNHRIYYQADFSYIDKSGKLVVEDVKGMKTAVYSLKKAMMRYFHKIDIREVWTWDMVCHIWEINQQLPRK